MTWKAKMGRRSATAHCSARNPQHPDATTPSTAARHAAKQRHDNYGRGLGHADAPTRTAGPFRSEFPSGRREHNRYLPPGHTIAGTAAHCDSFHGQPYVTVLRISCFSGAMARTTTLNSRLARRNWQITRTATSPRVRHSAASHRLLAPLDSTMSRGCGPRDFRGLSAEQPGSAAGRPAWA